MWQPNYRDDVCPRLRRAVDCLRNPDFEPIPLSEQEPAVWGKLDEKRQRLVDAAQEILVLTEWRF